MAILIILQTFGIVSDHLVHFYGFGTMHQDKSGNPDPASVKDKFCGVSVHALEKIALGHRNDFPVLSGIRWIVLLDKS
jgi:hypothetical protein